MTLEWLHSPVWVVLNMLAAYRLTRLWTRDSLPPLPKMREAVLQRWGDRPWAMLVDCPWCAGFWISLGVVLVASSPLAQAWQWLAAALAFSAVAGLLSTRDE